jgi:hypothetical protein
MATIKVTITVEDIDDTITIFDQIKVYRSTTGKDGAYLEITSPSTRIALVAGQSVYEYVDASGDPTYWYKVSYYNSVSTAESSLSDPRQGAVDPLYIDVDDLRDEGLSIPPGGDEEARALDLIRTYQEMVDAFTGQFFLPRQFDLDLDGSGTSLLQVPFPIISVANLYVNDEFETARVVEDYVAYTGRGGDDGRDDRRNPRIKLVTEEQSIFAGTGPVGRTGAIFEIGEKNQRIEGTFGFVEPDGCTPLLIKRAMKKLVIPAYNNPLGTSGAGGSAGGAPAGPVIEEETDRHRKRWADPYVGSKMWPVSGTGDAEVDMILSKYKRPLIVKGPRTMHGRNRRTWRSY